ncbi:xylose isomerase [Paenibacillus sp. Soil766]|uniref:sugar phosphate isomerase/epimerase family protein n=1 Tax=Paenibacillus sp. Soil766 TaxID=1736404 RepID=UPI00070E7B5C|nr:sugar phosphate isomerase/epimerase [Paenibacillus sp. Soil766]KRF06600.1 xylose isomerase [Paenibacillus sp. Soil766]
MKIAFQTLATPNWSWAHTLSEAKRMGYDGIELRGIDGEMYLPRARPFLPENIEQTLIDIERSGLEICCLDASSSFHDPDKLAQAIQEGKDYIDLAVQLKVPYIRVFGDLVPQTDSRAAVVARISTALTELGQYAEGKQVTVLLETHGDINNYQIIQEILAAASSSALGLLWDFGHPFFNKEDPEVTYRELAPYIKHTHVKDAKILPLGHELCLIGEGDVPVAEMIHILKRNHYDGWLSLEFEKKWYPDLLDEPEVSLPAYMAYVKGILA